MSELAERITKLYRDLKRIIFECYLLVSAVILLLAVLLLLAGTNH